MMAIYLWLNAALYLAFALWMTVLPLRTATAIGYVSLNNSGRSEYLVVYGGLQRRSHFPDARIDPLRSDGAKMQDALKKAV